MHDLKIFIHTIFFSKGSFRFFLVCLVWDGFSLLLFLISLPVCFHIHSILFLFVDVTSHFYLMPSSFLFGRFVFVPHSLTQSNSYWYWWKHILYHLAHTAERYLYKNELNMWYARIFMSFETWMTFFYYVCLVTAAYEETMRHSE